MAMDDRCRSWERRHCNAAREGDELAFDLLNIITTMYIAGSHARLMRSRSAAGEHCTRPIRSCQGVRGAGMPLVV